MFLAPFPRLEGPPGLGLPNERSIQSGMSCWTEPRGTIDAIAGRTVTMKPPFWEALPFAAAEDKPTPTPAYIENTAANFTQPGQWYLDSDAGVILYRPRAGETAADLERTAMVAANSTLVVLDGAQNMRWEHVQFSYASWNQASGPVGYVDIQSAQIFNGSVLAASTLQISQSRNLTFSSCTFKHLGGVYAIAAVAATQGLTVENCTFTDLSGGGVKFGSFANCSTGCGNGGPHANQWFPRADTPLDD